MRKSYFLLIFMLITTISNAFSKDFDIDFSVDEKLQKKYNASALEQDVLPPLPPSYYEQDLEVEEDVTSNIKQEVKNETNTPAKTVVVPAKTNISKLSAGTYKLFAGTKFMVKNSNAFSSSINKGAIVTFKTLYPQRVGKNEIPSGTTIKAVVENSHAPQLSGNGGLIELRAYEIIINGKAHQMNAKVILANNKKVFFNKIKGERKYIKNLSKPIVPANRFAGKMMKKTGKYINGGPKIILAPFTFISGTAALGGAIIVSPVVSLFSKGGKLYFPAGTTFNFKLIEDTGFSI